MEKLEGLSKNIELTEREKLASVFPQCFVEGKLDIDKLLSLCGEYILKDFEKYEFTWKGKSECLRLAQQRSTATLRPCPEESVNFDTTQNLYIEGDNLEVLKLLQASYFRQVKMIYIDPPYNTGNDFVYEDDFKDPLERYREVTSQTTKSNPEVMGRFHTNWLNMMYPRLRLAANLLRDDGVIFISIDDHEVHNLRKLCDEVFGEENFVACLVWEKGRKNDAKLFSVGHEYLLLYAKSLCRLRELKTIWRENKPGTKEIWEKYLKLREEYGTDDASIEKELQQWFSSLPAKHPSKKWSRYKRVDANGPWRDRDISWPGGGGPRYDVIHPITGKACKVPERGWIYSSPQEMQRQISLGLVEFRKDETDPPFRKAHIRPVHSGDELDLVNEESNEEELATQVRGSYFYKQSQVAIKYFRKLLGGKFFDNPKDHFELAKLFDYVCGDDSNAIILDFFSGSGSTAHAVMQLNAEDGGKRRFIMVQLPELCPESSETFKAGYRNICEIGKERIRRAGAKILENIEPAKQHEKQMTKHAEQLSLVPDGEDASGNSPLPDTGFKVFKLDSSNLKTWDSTPFPEDDLLSISNRLHNMIDRIKPDRTDLDVVYEIMLKMGVPLTYNVSPVDISGKIAWSVGDFLLLICLSDGLTVEMVEEMAEYAPGQIVLAENSLADDTAMSNAFYILRDRNIELKLV